MKIYTKTGDLGQTALIGGTRVKKHHLRIETYGTVDELNSYIGLLRAFDLDDKCKAQLIDIQQLLFAIGALLAADPEKSSMKLYTISLEDVCRLEKAIDDIEEQLPSLKHFILPGGNLEIAHTHIARCVCRRAERCIVALAAESVIGEQIICYMNRLSDYLFVFSRYLAKQMKVEEEIWLPK